MSKAKVVTRVLEGLIFLFAGVSFFFMKEMPPPPTPELGTFMAGLMASKYFFYLLKVTEVACGALLVSGFYVPLALVILSPIVVNIFFVHAFMAQNGLPLALVIVLLHVANGYFNMDVYRPMLKKK